MSGIKGLRTIEFKSITNYNGNLISLENKESIPFSIARIFYIWRTKKGQIRGKHAHKKCQQVLINLQGVCEVICTDGDKEISFLLKKPNVGLFVPAMVWTIQRFKADQNILLVVANMKFNEKDYIRNYNDFLHLKWNH